MEREQQEKPKGRRKSTKQPAKRIERQHTPLSRASDRTGPGVPAEQVWTIEAEGQTISRSRRTDTIRAARRLGIKQTPIRQRIAR